MSEKTAKRILLEAAELIEGPGKWTQGAVARDPNGDEIDADSRHAVCFCVAGAISRAALGGVGPLRLRLYYAALSTARRVAGVPLLARWNDEPGRTQAEAVALLRKAAELAP